MFLRKFHPKNLIGVQNHINNLNHYIYIMEKDALTLYKQKGGFQSMGWQVNNSILKGGGDFVVPAALLYINNNFDCKSCNSVEKGVVNSDLYDKLYSFIDKSKSSKNKTKKRRNKKKRKNKTRRY